MKCSMVAGTREIEGFLCALLREEHPAWPSGQDEGFAETLLARANDHGVLPLLHRALNLDLACHQGWPTEVLEACRQQTIAHTLWELRHRHLLGQTIEALNEAGIQPVLFKGTALAYSLYANPVMRVRSDTDFIIPPQTLNAVAKVLASCGFVRDTSVEVELINYQAGFVCQQTGGGDHVLDVHWRINNSQILAKLFTYEELLSKSIPLPRLSPHASAVSPAHAMLLACMHRATHKQNPCYVDGMAYYSGDRLVWIYDVHLLAAGLSRRDWDGLVRMAQEKGLCAVCMEGFNLSRTYFRTEIPGFVLAALKGHEKTETVARYFARGALGQQWMDFRAIPGCSGKRRFLAETFFPPADYMRKKYPQAQPDWIVWLYLRRAAGGALKRLNRQAKTA